MDDLKNIKTLGDLKKSSYKARSVKDEVRNHLVENLKNGQKNFEGILGFDDTVLPELERALLSKHNILFLGLRGQAKTRIARLVTNLLDDYIPIVKGSEINDDPLAPLSRYAIDLIKEKGDDTPITWIANSERYVEKLATPDVSISDLIGDVDPIKAATLKLPYSDERVIHFGLVPRANRGIFVINELPDLQARIQVSLFNILQEGDLQIRGFKLRLPLDILFIFTANPEDYTNRGSIVTPLKDRIESQILTHYPVSIEIAQAITDQEARIEEKVKKSIILPEYAKEMLEIISFVARESEFIDEKSGVSARLSISARENLYSMIERRMIINNEKKSIARITDFWGVIPSITGKVELVYEGEQEGHYQVALNLISEAAKSIFLDFFEDPDSPVDPDKDPYGTIKAYFNAGNFITLGNDESDQNYKEKLEKVVGLRKLIEQKGLEHENVHFFMELVLHGLAAFNLITKEYDNKDFIFSDPISDIFDQLEDLD